MAERPALPCVIASIATTRVFCVSSRAASVAIYWPVSLLLARIPRQPPVSCSQPDGVCHASWCAPPPRGLGLRHMLTCSRR